MKELTFFVALFLIFGQIYADDDPLSTTPPSLLFELLALNGDLETAQRPKYLSPTSMTLSPDKELIYIAEQTAKQVDVFSVATNSVIKSFLMPNEPTGIAVDSSGSRLYVTCASERWPNGMVCVVNAASGTIENRISVGHMARSPVLSPDEKNLYVCNWLEGTISFVNLSATRETQRVPAIREPYSMAISKNGNSLIIANLIPDGVATDTTMASKICFISTSTGKIEKEIKLYKGSHSTMSVRLSPDGKYAFIPHLIANFTQVGGTLDQGWVHSNNMSIIDVEKQVLLNDVEIDYTSQGFANPWDIACTDDGKWICIAHAGYDILSIIDMPALFTKLVGKGDASRDYTFMNGMKKEVRMGIRSPRSIVTIGSKAYVTGFFSHSLEVVDLSAASLTPTKYALAPEKPLTMERKGESFFCDAKLSFNQWQTCQSCHPFTRPDGLNWILSDAVNAASKNAKSMLLSWQTPPTNWTGRRINTFESIRAGVSLELRTDPSAEAGLSLDTFFMRLKPVPSPKLVKGKLSESAKRGRTIYYDSEKLNCIRCHPAPLFTNLKAENAGILDDLDNSAFDTPSIIEAWRTGPYDHIGSHDKMEDCLKVPGHAEGLDNLSDSEFKDLIEYVLSL
jgi:DNA-binding beta-propeller fold protein YncE